MKCSFCSVNIVDSVVASQAGLRLARLAAVVFSVKEDLRGSFTSSRLITIHEMGRLGAKD